MDADDVERVVEAQLVLQSDGQRTDDASESANDDRADRGDRGAGRGDGDQAGDDARCGAEGGGMAVADPLGDQPAKEAAAVATMVFTQTTEAVLPAASAEPALKPNQPNHSRPAPSMTRVRLCGRIGSRFQPSRLPSMMARARPATPALMWTAVPPAKSIAFELLAIQPPTWVQSYRQDEVEHPVGDREVDDGAPRCR